MQRGGKSINYMKTKKSESDTHSPESIDFPIPRLIAFIGIAIVLGWFMPALRGSEISGPISSISGFGLEE